MRIVHGPCLNCLPKSVTIVFPKDPKWKAELKIHTRTHTGYLKYLNRIQNI